MLKMNEQEIYQKIGELLWSIMPNEAIEIYFIGDIYPEHYSGGAEWRLKNEPYRVCRRVNILRDYPDDKIKIYP